MTVSSRSLLVLVAFPLLVLGYTANLGFYSPVAMGLALAAAIMVFVAALAPPRQVNLGAGAAGALLYGPVTVLMVLVLRQAALTSNGLLALLAGLLAIVGVLVALLAHLAGIRPTDPLRAGMIGAGILLAGQAVLTCQLRYPDPTRLAAQLGLLSTAVLGYLVWLSFLAQPTPGRGWRVRLGLLFAVGLAVRALAVVGSPEPVIDVNAWLRQAPSYLLAGRNPYATDYASPYGTDRARRAGINDAPDPRPATYPPLAIITGLPAVLLGFDVRYINVLADLLAALLIVLATRAGPRPDLGLLAAGLYLTLPRTPFMMEQAWFEPQLAALVGVLLWQAERVGRVWRPALALGALLAAKQLAIALLPVLLKAYWNRKPLLLIGLAVALVLIVPFVLWSPADFWDIVVAKHLARPVMTNSLTLLSLAHQACGLELPPFVTWAIAAVLIALVTWRAPRAVGPGLGLWLGASLLAFILGHKQGYFNYYVLTAYLLLWGLAGTADDSAAEADHEAPG